MRSWLLGLALLAPALAAAQGAGGADPLGGGPRLYAGAGLGPGIGGVVIGSDPVLDLLTREAALYADVVPRIAGGSGRLLTAVGVGGGIRVLRVVDILQNRDPGRFDLDAGVRIGPSFYTAFFEQTAESEARAFSIMLDPFARGTVRLGARRVVFAEVGTQAPAFRAGLSARLRR